MTAINLDDELVLEESRWRGFVLTFLALLGVAVAIAVALWWTVVRDDSVATIRSTEDLEVKRATISQALIVSGTADAQLNSNLVFQSSGKVAFVNVKIGDAVRQGQVLASLESDDVSNAVSTARANLAAAQLKLDDLLDPSDASDIATAEQGVATAQAALTKAENDYNDLLDGSSASDIATAEQGVRAAEAQLATALSNREKLNDVGTGANLAAAESGVAAAESSLTAAENSAASAQNTVTTAETLLKNAEANYCVVDASPSFCSGLVAPISGGDASIMNSQIGGANALLASGVTSANGTYLNAVNSLDSANASVSSARESLNAARAKLDAALDGATREELDAAAAAVTSAESGLFAAQQKLLTAQQGATAFQLSTASAAVESARRSLTAAEAKRDDAYRGAEANAIAQATQAVATAQLNVEAAQIRLTNAQIVAPFDGTVASVSIEPGEFFSFASAEGAAIVLLTPDAMIFRLDVGETDYASLKVGQSGGVVFDSIPGAPYPFTISEIGLAPTVNQGVVTYTVEASLTIPPGGARPAPGMNARGQIITSSKPDVLVVPPRAIRRKGNDQVVDVRVDGGIEERVVTTGVTDNDNVEVVTGLEEGDVIVLAALAGAAEAEEAEAEPTLPGGIR